MKESLIPGILPCPENWDGMQAAAGGKHCASCDKFIPDMVDLRPEEIAARYEAAGGKLCGRVRADRVQVLRLQQEVWVKPALPQAMRQFVLAFVAAFGLSIWGFSTAEAAPVLPPETALSLSQPDSLYRLEGVVMDSTTGEPVHRAYVSMKVNGKVLDAAQTDSMGRFLLVAPRHKLKRGRFDLVVSWMGQSVISAGIPADVQSAQVKMSTTLDMPVVEITDSVLKMHEQSLHVHDIEPVVISGITHVGVVSRYVREIPLGPLYPGDKYYHKLEDYIQMRSSEVHMQGRW